MPRAVGPMAGRGPKPANVRNKRAVIQKVIRKMQTAVQGRIIKFLQTSFKASSRDAFAVAKMYLRKFRFEELKNVYYSDLDVQTLVGLYRQVAGRGKKSRAKSGLPAIAANHKLQRHGQSEPTYQQQRQAQQQLMMQQRQQQQQKISHQPLVDINAHKRGNAHRNNMPTINATGARNANSKPGPMTSSRKPQKNVWAAIMNYDVEMKRKEDEAKKVAQRRALKEYEQELARQVAERRARERAEEVERESQATLIQEDVEKFKEEAEALKRKQLEKILHANREAERAEERRRLRIEEARRDRERAKLVAKEELEKLAKITRDEKMQQEQKMQRQRLQLREEIRKQRLIKEELAAKHAREEKELAAVRIRVQTEKDRRRKEAVDRREQDIKNRMAKMGGVFHKEREQAIALDNKADREMARYNELKDEEMARRRAVQEAQRLAMMRSVEEMRQAKLKRRRDEEEQERRFAEEIKRQDQEHWRAEQVKARRHAERLKQNANNLHKQLEEREVIKRQFEEPAEVVTMNHKLLGKIARESEDVDVSDLMGKLPKMPQRYLLKQREAKLQIGGRGTHRAQY